MIPGALTYEVTGHCAPIRTELERFGKPIGSGRLVAAAVVCQPHMNAERFFPAVPIFPETFKVIYHCAGALQVDIRHKWA
jgi:hypothetical protein